MSQHLLTEFINRTYVFKPFNDAKIVNHRVKKYQGSNRNNNVSPEVLAESRHALHKTEIQKNKEDKQQSIENNAEQEHIDITV